MPLRFTIIIPIGRNLIIKIKINACFPHPHPCCIVSPLICLLSSFLLFIKPRLCSSLACWLGGLHCSIEIVKIERAEFQSLPWVGPYLINRTMSPTQCLQEFLPCWIDGKFDVVFPLICSFSKRGAFDSKQPPTQRLEPETPSNLYGPPCYM